VKYGAGLHEWIRHLLRNQCIKTSCLSCVLLLLAGATSGAMDAGNLLKPMLGRGELRCIGATTLDEYRKYIEKDPALERRFQQVYVDQPSVEDTISILRGLRERYELHHGVRISDSALVEAAVLADRYISDRFLPDKGPYSCSISLCFDLFVTSSTLSSPHLSPA
jgi:hypothetical protein